METRKVIIRTKKPESKTEAKQKRYENRIAERKANKKPSKDELLKLEGKRFFNFVLDIESTEKWCKECEALGQRPNDRIAILIQRDMK